MMPEWLADMPNLHTTDKIIIANFSGGQLKPLMANETIRNYFD